MNEKEMLSQLSASFTNRYLVSQKNSNNEENEAKREVQRVSPARRREKMETVTHKVEKMLKRRERCRGL